MTNNDVLKRLRYILNFSDSQMLEVLSLGALETDIAIIKTWLVKDDHADFKACEDRELASFLNGLILFKRGAQEGREPVVEEKLDNNTILKKLMIAFSLKSDDVIGVLKLADLRVGKSELSAFFRKRDHRNFRECKSQVLRNFLMGLQLKSSPKSV